MAAGALSVTVEGLDELAVIPRLLDRAQRRLLERASSEIAEKIGEEAPGGAGGSIARATRARQVSDTKAEVTVDHPGARTLERGAVIRPRNATILRFEVGGETVYARETRIPPQRFAERALRTSTRIASRAYLEAFGDLKRNR